MSIFGKHRAGCPIVEIQNLTINICEEKPKANPVHLILKQQISNSIYQIMALSLPSNQLVVGTLGLVDAVTSAAVTGSFAGTGATSDNAAAFTASVDASGNVVVTGVAAGAGNLTVTTNASYTDSTGAAQTKSLTTSVPVTITAVVTADAVNLVVNFGTPTNQ